MSYFVYILFSDTTGRYYIGHTQNFANRLSEHNHGETSSIRAGIPWREVWTIEFSSRADAMKLEKKIKSRGAKRFLEDQAK
jgi:putative endonuclease